VPSIRPVLASLPRQRRRVIVDQRVKREHLEQRTPRSAKGFACAGALRGAGRSPSRRRRPDTAR